MVYFEIILLYARKILVLKDHWFQIQLYLTTEHFKFLFVVFKLSLTEE